MKRMLVTCTAALVAALALSGCELIGYLANPNLRQSALSDLTVTPGTMTPGFSKGTSTYDVTVASGVTSFTITATSVSPTAKIELMVSLNDWVTVASGSPSPAIPLSYSSALIEVSVTAEDGQTTNSYWVHVMRA